MTFTVAGLSGFGRSCAALVRDGALAAAAAEELFSRRKNDPALPEKAYRFACARAGIAAPDFVAFAEKPVQRFVRILGGLASGFPFTLKSFPRTLTTWLGDRLWLKNALMKALELDPDRILFVERPLAQCASAFLTSPFDEAAVLVVDSVGEWAATTLAVGRSQGSAHGLEVLAEIQHPHSLAYFLDAVAHHLLVPESGGLRWLAPLCAWGEPRLAPVMAEIVRPEADGAYSLDARSFDLSGGTARFTPRVQKRLGAPRGAGQSLNCAGPRSADARRFADVARSAQCVVEERCLALAHEAKRRTGLERLCLGGSVFLHPAVAARLLRDAPFAEVWVDPCLDDGAAALGAALYVSHVVQKLPRAAAAAAGAQATAAAAHGDDCAPAPVPPGAQWDVRAKSQGDLVAAAVEDLAAGGIAGLVTGPPELSPRSRGNRVLLCDPGREDAVLRLRQEVKLAEPYVPLGMVGLASATAAFSAPRERVAAAAGLATVTVDNGALAALRGAVHVDGTALLHAVDAVAQPLLGSVLAEFAARTGRPPILAHTSFNRAGEPVVLTPMEAIDLLRRSTIDVVVWGDCEVRRRAGVKA